jgi:iron-sulfur cluster repair protein YtfE (RIC family)
MVNEKENINPIRRSKELSTLSRDHHEGLLLCWKIRTGIKYGIDTRRISSYIIYFFENDLEEHFKEEEQYVFPLLGNANTNRKKAEEQHKLLRTLIGLISESNTNTNLLTQFADRLEEHIRYEERVLFGIIETGADKDSLAKAAASLKKTNACKTEWADNFWLKEK